MKNLLIVIVILASNCSFGALYRRDFEGNSKSGWYACGGTIKVIRQPTVSVDSKYALQAKSTTKQLVISSPKTINQVITPGTKLEFDWRIDNREPVKYIAFGIVTDKSKGVLWLNKNAVGDYSPAKWHHFNIPFSKFKVKDKCTLKSFVIQLAANGTGGQVFTIDNFELNNNKNNFADKVESKTANIWLKNSRENSACLPMATVSSYGRPELDGKLNDPCWKKSTMLSVVPNCRGGKLFDNTQFMLSYDDKFLYVAARVEQACLDPVLNLLDKVKVKATKHDSNVYCDDSIEIFLSPPGAGGYYQFAVNMDGVVYDAKNKSADWNGNIKLKTRKNQKSWNVEIAMPLKTLGVKKLNGEKWQANFCRNNPQKNETGAWSPTEGYFHKQKYFGILRFEKKSPIVRFEKIEIKKQSIKADVAFYNSRELSIHGAENPRTISAGESGSIQLNMKPQEDGMGQFVVKEGAKDIARSALFQIKNISQRIKAEIYCPDSQISLFVNGKKIANSKNRISKSFELKNKVNTVALKISSKDVTKISGGFSQGNINYSLYNWLCNNKLHDGWYASGFDDKNWELFSKRNTGKVLYMRCKFIKNNTFFAPQLENNTMYILNKVTQKCSIRISSPLNTPLADYQQHLIMPNQVKIPMYDFSNRLYKRYKNEYIKHKIKNNTEYIFKFTQPVKKLVYNWGFNCISTLVRAGCKSENTNTLKYGNAWITGRGISELPRKFAVKILPEPEISQPSKAKIVFHTGFRNKIFSTREYVKLLPGWEKIGINLIGDLYQVKKAWFDSSNSFFANCRKNNIAPYVLIFGPRCSGFMDVLTSDPTGAAVTPLRKYHNFEKPFCPLYFVSSKKIAKRIGRIAKMSYGILDDIEAGLKTSCFCERCRKYFSKKIGSGKVLSTKEILDSYKDKWLIHKLEMNQKVCRFIFDSAKKTNPSIKTMMYSGYASCPTSQYGVAWEMYKGFVDIPMSGYSESTSIIKNTRKALGGQKIIAGILLDSNLWEHPYADQNIKARLWKIFIAGGCLGINVWNWYDLDGRGLSAINEFARGVSKYENFLNENNEISVRGIDPKVCKVYKHGKDYLYLAMNHGISPLKIKVRFPESLSNPEVYNFYENKKIKVHKGGEVTISPRDVLLLKITAKK